MRTAAWRTRSATDGEATPCPLREEKNRPNGAVMPCGKEERRTIKSPGARTRRCPQEDYQRRERAGVERVVRRKLSGSEGELWQLSDDMKDAPSTRVEGESPPGGRRVAWAGLLQTMPGRNLFVTGGLVKVGHYAPLILRHRLQKPKFCDWAQPRAPSRQESHAKDIWRLQKWIRTDGAGRWGGCRRGADPCRQGWKNAR